MAKGGKGGKGGKMPISKISSYVMGIAAMLGGSKARQYKSCIFGNKGGRPRPGHIARCNRLFFGKPGVSVGKKRGAGKPSGGGGRAGGAHQRGGGGQAKIAGAGPGQASKGGGPGKRRAREGR